MKLHCNSAPPGTRHLCTCHTGPCGRCPQCWSKVWRRRLAPAQPSTEFSHSANSSSQARPPPCRPSAGRALALLRLAGLASEPPVAWSCERGLPARGRGQLHISLHSLCIRRKSKSSSMHTFQATSQKCCVQAAHMCGRMRPLIGTVAAAAHALVSPVSFVCLFVCCMSEGRKGAFSQQLPRAAV